jgi:hypothetical protein
VVRRRTLPLREQSGAAPSSHQYRSSTAAGLERALAFVVATKLVTYSGCRTSGWEARCFPRVTGLPKSQVSTIAAGGGRKPQTRISM